MSLGEGGTPAEAHPALAAALGLDRLVLKREDASPTGSHKDRGVAFQVSVLASTKPRPDWLIISSSGNAAIATARYGREAGISVAAFVAPRTPPAKLALIAAGGAVVLLADRALTLARDVAAARGWPNLRPSTDSTAPEGFQSLGWELLEVEPPVEAVFTFASSATSLVGIGRAWQEALGADRVASVPELHVVQGTGAHPVAGEFDPREVHDVRGRVGALGARKTRRVGEAKRLLRAFGGSGWVVTDAEAEAADRLLAEHGIDAALEGAAALAAAARAARERGLRSAAVVITGAKRRLPAEADPLAGARSRMHEVASLDAALQALARHGPGAGTVVAAETSPPTREPVAVAATPAVAIAPPAVDVRSPADFATWAAEHAPGLSYAGPDPHYGIGLESLVPTMRFACIDDAPAGRLLAEHGQRVLTLGDAVSGRNTRAVLEAAEMERFLADGNRARLLVFKSSHAIAERCRAMGWQLLASDARLARRWENKVAFREIAARLGLAQPPGEVVALAETRYEDLADRLGPRLVVQGPHGYAGNKTFAVEDAAGFEAAAVALRGRQARVTARLAGETWTLNACVTARGVAVGAPFRQLTGFPELTTYALGSCGQDWSATTRMGAVLAPVLDMGRRVGEGLAAEGYLGIFGIDVLLPPGGEAVIIEVNPRLVASIAAYTQLELAAGRLPLLARHVMALCDPSADGAPLDHHEVPLGGGQLVLHHVGDQETQTPALPTGWYGPRAVDVLSRGEGTAALAPAVTPAHRIDHPAPPAEAPWLVLAPEAGRPIAPGDAWCRVQTRRAVSSGADLGDGLEPGLMALVRSLQGQLDV